MSPSKKNLALSSLLLAGLLLTGCGTPEEKEARYLKRGNEFFDRGEYEKARVEYKNAARIKPTEAEPRYRLGLVEEAEGNLRVAFADFLHAEEQDPHFHPTLIKLADYYLVGNQLEQAQKRIDVVLSDLPDDPEGHALRAALLLHQKDYAGTEKEARFALEKDVTNATAYMILTGLYMAQGDLGRTETTIDDGVAHDPHDLSLLTMKARVYEQARDLQKVSDTYKTIFELKPKEKHYRVDLAHIYLKMGKIDDAEATLRAGVAAMPDDEEMEHQLVAFLSDQHGLDAAEHEIQQYIGANPDRDKLSLWLVDLYLQHDAFDRAIALLNQIIEKHTSDQEGFAARTALAHIDYIKGDRKAADALATAVLEKDPNNLDALFIKAQIAFDGGFYESAVADLRTIIRARPKTKEALQLLSATFLQQGHLDLAIDTQNQLVEADPTDIAGRVRLAQLYYTNGDTKHAMDMLFLVTKEQPKYPLGWESTARIAIASKDWATAKTAIDALIGLEGQQMVSAFLQGQLLAATGKPADAIPQYTRVINADPASPLAERALTALIEAYHAAGRMEEAVTYIESLKTRTAAVNTALGQMYLSLNKIDMAAAAFDAALATSPPQQEPYLERAKIFLHDHKTDQAIDILKKGAAVAPADMRAPIMEAEILGSAGRYEEAAALYEDILLHNPGLDIVANNLAELIADYEYTDPVALEKARQAAERFTAAPNPLLLDTLAWVYYRLGNLQQSQILMERAMGTGITLPPQVHYHYGALLLKLGKTEKAKAELQQATVDGANYPGLDDAKKLLTGL